MVGPEGPRRMKSHQKVQTAQVARSCCGPAFQPSSLRDPSPPHEGTMLRHVRCIAGWQVTHLRVQVVREEILATFAGALLKKMMQAWIKQALECVRVTRLIISHWMTDCENSLLWTVRIDSPTQFFYRFSQRSSAHQSLKTSIQTVFLQCRHEICRRSSDKQS